MRSATKCSIWAVLLTALMIASTIQLPEEIAEEEVPAETSARQNSVEAACEGLTFEDMFNYTHAIFDIRVNDDWESADVSAVAWINGTLSDQVRIDLESLFEAERMHVASIQEYLQQADEVSEADVVQQYDSTRR